MVRLTDILVIEHHVRVVAYSRWAGALSFVETLCLLTAVHHFNGFFIFWEVTLPLVFSLFLGFELNLFLLRGFHHQLHLIILLVNVHNFVKRLVFAHCALLIHHLHQSVTVLNWLTFWETTFLNGTLLQIVRQRGYRQIIDLNHLFLFDIYFFSKLNYVLGSLIVIELTGVFVFVNPFKDAVNLLLEQVL